jgi:NAD+ kinase
MIDKIYLVFDKTKNSLKIKNSLNKIIKTTTLKKSQIIIVLGGDGFMLQTLKRLYRLKKPFYGINSGNYGFLMNKFSNKNFVKNLKTSHSVKIYPLQMTVKTKVDRIKKSIAINEVSILRQSKQASSLSITSNKKNIIKKLVSDGVLVSTPAGSTAYNLSAHGPILNLDSNKLAVTPISPFRPRRWRGTIVSDKSKIIIKNLDPNKRPISVVADNYEVRNAKNISINANKKITFNLLYDKNNSLYKKIKIEQVRKETSNN